MPTERSNASPPKGGQAGGEALEHRAPLLRPRQRPGRWGVAPLQQVPHGPTSPPATPRRGWSARPSGGPARAGGGWCCVRSGRTPGPRRRSRRRRSPAGSRLLPAPSSVRRLLLLVTSLALGYHGLLTVLDHWVFLWPPLPLGYYVLNGGTAGSGALNRENDGHP